jgi:DNA-binding MarR family transcriptional regulator
VELTEKGREVLNADRRRRDGWLARALEEDFSPDEQTVLNNAVELLRRLAERPV